MERNIEKDINQIDAISLVNSGDAKFKQSILGDNYLILEGSNKVYVFDDIRRSYVFIFTKNSPRKIR